MGEERTMFDPSKYLTKIGGADYLEVKWRLLWLRSEYPEATIDTELIEHDRERSYAIVKATVTLPTGARATGFSLTEPTSIAKDYVANAETSAIGRALAALGYGTQFCREFDGAASGRVVDSPVRPNAGRRS